MANILTMILTELATHVVSYRRLATVATDFSVELRNDSMDFATYPTRTRNRLDVSPIRRNITRANQLLSRRSSE